MACSSAAVKSSVAIRGERGSGDLCQAGKPAGQRSALRAGQPKQILWYPWKALHQSSLLARIDAGQQGNLTA